MIFNSHLSVGRYLLLNTVQPFIVNSSNLTAVYWSDIKQPLFAQSNMSMKMWLHILLLWSADTEKVVIITGTSACTLLIATTSAWKHASVTWCYVVVQIIMYK